MTRGPPCFSAPEESRYQRWPLRMKGRTKPAAGLPGDAARSASLARDADVVFVAHTGVEHMTTVLDVWRELPMDREIEMRWWIVPADEVPPDREARIEWLFAWWATIDDWINARQAEVRGS